MPTQNYKMFSDVTSDIDKEMLADLSEVTFVPMNITVGDEGYVYSYGDDGTITVEEFYQKLRSGLFASTSQINPEVYEEYFEPELKAGNDIIYIGLTSGLSQTLNSSRVAARNLMEQYPDRRIEIVDPFDASLGQGFLLYEAVREMRAGLSMDELLNWIEEHKLHVCHWFTVDTFEHLKRGGRVSGATAAMGTVLQVKPLLTVDDEGKLETIAKPRGRKQATAALIDHVKNSIRPELGTFIYVGHADNLAAAEEIRDELKQLYPNSDIRITDIGPVIGAHVGPGMTTVVNWGDR
ncbi:MAG: DegV family protein [Oscillospiraceae bacterium]|nr:DegV family protein [Oscillospiraceae bacterium]